MMKIAVFGATGRTGMQVVQQALAAGHEVVALARTPSKLTLSHPQLTVVTGDVQTAAAVAQTVTGVDAVVSVLGPTSNQPGRIISAGTQNILTAMQQQNVKRLIVSAGAGVGDPQDQPKLFNKAISLLLKTFSRHVYEDMVHVVELVRTSDRDWTVVRVPMLTDGPLSGQVRIGMVGQGTGPRLSRADMAAFMLQQMTDRTYLHKSPVISN
jgi:putative NADH-flavin reductase